MIPVGSRLVLSFEGMQERVILRNGTLSNESDTIRIVSSVLRDSMPMLNKAA
jgi:hypothetical protein